ncbi:hypothetical protein MIND_01278000 [Mycena indigotica]|uniref:EB1 C-terminal domain-containing protein n=1 Tax=Mycena indigotica TaxID=2126181 RepID=A0A8H6S113_9AGAR|nr:uncharacterized protein MIND_01278000 [Mycena indigotica]KAF7291335.1 hypothetical protein MIND_01278000 [Mycena indigotica]
MAGASRTELIQWVNDLLGLNYTKVEQCGTGGAYLQILDSIYLDVPMARVKMAARQEYESLANYKIMQGVFKAKKIDKPIPVEKLVKCKMQDNLEFLQRKGAAAEPATLAPVAPKSMGTGKSTAGAGASRANARTPVSGHRSGTPNNATIIALNNQVSELTTHIEGLEKERDFYFEKLREIEIMVQQRVEALEQEGQDDDTLREIQKVLYATEDGFEVPEQDAAADEEETF